jgi:hypothetical protein
MKKGVEMCIKLTMRDSGAKMSVLTGTTKRVRLARTSYIVYNSIPTPLCVSGCFRKQETIETSKGVGAFKRTKMARSKLQAQVAETLAVRFGQYHIKENYRPAWFVSERGERLEMDFYINELRLAIEVQGAQHYVFTPRFHADMLDFEAQLRRDESKRDLCYFHNIRLYAVASMDDLLSVLEPIEDKLRLMYNVTNASVFIYDATISRQRSQYIKHSTAKLSDRLHMARKAVRRAATRLDSCTDPERAESFQRLLAVQVTRFRSVQAHLRKATTSAAIYFDCEIFPKYHKQGTTVSGEKG